jgi:hypothetical protein
MVLRPPSPPPLFPPYCLKIQCLKYAAVILPILFGIETLTIVSGEEYCRLKVSEVMVLRRIFGPVRKYEKDGENYTMYYIVCTVHHILRVIKSTRK